MAKKKRVPLNRLVTEETFDLVKSLAVSLECSEGEVLDQAVMLLESTSSQNGGASANSDLDHSLAGFRAPEPVVDTRPKNASCRHCGNRFAGPKFATICPGCKSIGHTLVPAECPVCTEGQSI